MPCVVCGATMTPVLAWYSRCQACGFRRSTLITATPDRDPIDEARRAAGLSGLRQQNFARIVDVLARLHDPRGKRLLDVGCAHGWFLDAAASRGYDTIGLEPDDAIAAQARTRGHEVRSGLFPADAPTGDVDVVTFHDTFEHLADERAAMRWCEAHLPAGGLLVINLPTSDGAIYRAAEAMSALGVRGPVGRMWQKGFPSPHVSYFSASTLASLARAHGFEEVHREAIPAFAVRGLWSRLSYDRRLPLPAAALLWTGIVALSPLLRMLPADTFFAVFRKRSLQSDATVRTMQEHEETHEGASVGRASRVLHARHWLHGVSSTACAHAANGGRSRWVSHGPSPHGAVLRFGRSRLRACSAA